MQAKKTLILTDNQHACDLAHELDDIYNGIDVFQSPNGDLTKLPRLNIRDSVSKVCSEYNLVISIHCKQFFPSELVNRVRCVNVHPGLNPHNRGWFPQVFSIINGLPAGVTIHEMDEKLDHGPIIAQKEYTIHSWDTSGSVYKRILAIERELVLNHFIAIRDKTYMAFMPHTEGNVNFKRDFDKLKRIDLERKGTFGEFINILRALTHDEYRNAYFEDDSGIKVFVKINLETDRQ